MAYEMGDIEGTITQHAFDRLIDLAHTLHQEPDEVKIKVPRYRRGFVAIACGGVTYRKFCHHVDDANKNRRVVDRCEMDALWVELCTRLWRKWDGDGIKYRNGENKAHKMWRRLAYAFMDRWGPIIEHYWWEKRMRCGNLDLNIEYVADEPEDYYPPKALPPPSTTAADTNANDPGKEEEMDGGDMEMGEDELPGEEMGMDLDIQLTIRVRKEDNST